MSALAVGVSFGRVISHKHWDKTFLEHFKVPSLLDILFSFWKPSFWMYGNWMTLGDDNSDNIGEQTKAQQGNLALVSALWLTIQFTFMYSFPADWDTIKSESYIANSVGDENATFIHEFLIAVCLTSCSANTVACVYSVLVILVSGEMNSSQELNYLHTLMGRWMYVSFPLLCLSITLWSVKSLIYQIMLCQSMTGVIFTTVPPCILMFGLVLLAGNIIQHAYKVKYIEGLKRGTDELGSSLWGSALFVTYTECKQLLDKFGEECGFHNLSEKVLVEYACIFARGKALARARQENQDLSEDSPQFAAVEMLNLSELCRSWVKELVEAKINQLKSEKYVDQDAKNSVIGTVLSNDLIFEGEA